MGYEAFSRKYRPKSFSEVIGQDYVVKTLKNAIKLGRVSHAYIFSGSRGIGKTTIARIVAKALNCKNPADYEPCNQCENCIEIEKGSFPDLYEIDAASNRGIDDIRTIRDNVNYAPIKGNYKIYIIDEAHMLTKEAFNALLKTLEEPPPKNIFILATTEAYKIPDTIKSRCQIFNFKPPTKQQIKTYLQSILQKENIDYEEEALSLLVEESEGGMRDFASLLDQAVVFSEGKLTVKAIQELLGIIPEKYINQTIKDIREMKLEDIIKNIEKLETEGYDLNIYWKQLTDKLNEELIKISIEGKGVFFSKEDEKKLIYILSLLNRATIESKNFQNPKHIFQLYILKLRYLEYIKPVEEIISSIAKSQVVFKTQEKEPQKNITEKSEHKEDTDIEHLYKALKSEPVLLRALQKFDIEVLPEKIILKTKDFHAGEFVKDNIQKLKQILKKEIELFYPQEKEQKKSSKRDESVDKILELFPGSKILKYETKED